MSMTDRQLELYNNLMSLCDPARKDCPFYYTDQEVISEKSPEKYKGWKYRIFSNMLATYSDWLLSEDSFWARGTMFLVNEKDEVQELTCLPMKKFFNLNENPFSQVGDRLLTEDLIITEKRDGSLMDQFIDIDGNLRLKSKKSTKSEHCKRAMNLLNTREYLDLKSFLIEMSNRSITIDLEYCAPTNRIVIGYEKESLTILSAQCLLTTNQIDLANLC